MGLEFACISEVRVLAGERARVIFQGRFLFVYDTKSERNTLQILNNDNLVITSQDLFLSVTFYPFNATLLFLLFETARIHFLPVFFFSHYRRRPSCNDILSRQSIKVAITTR